MKGVINLGLQEFIAAKFGAEAWENIKEKADCNEPFFAISEDYPDSMTVELAQAASDILQLSLDDVLFEFGRFWIPNTGKNNYGIYYGMAGSFAREFLLNMDKVHKHVTNSLINVSPPLFEYEDLPDGRLLMKYASKRKLCPLLKGLILGVGDLFNEELQVRETTCQRKGDPQCIMEITFP